MNGKVTEFKKDLIIEAAGKYFSSVGYKGLQVDKMAKELGIGVGTIYSMFDSKEGLFLSWIFSLMEKAYVELKKNFEQLKNPLSQLEFFVRFKLDYYEQNKSVLRDYMQNNQLFLKNTSRRKENPVQKTYQLVADSIEKLFNEQNLFESSPTNDFQLLAFLLDGTISSYIERFAQEGEDVNFVTKTEEVIQIFLNSIGARGLKYEA